MIDSLPNADRDDIVACELLRRVDRILGLLAATDVAMQAAGRQLTEDELGALWCVHWG